MKNMFVMYLCFRAGGSTRGLKCEGKSEVNGRKMKRREEGEIKLYRPDTQKVHNSFTFLIDSKLLVNFWRNYFHRHFGALPRFSSFVEIFSFFILFVLETIKLKLSWNWLFAVDSIGWMFMAWIGSQPPVSLAARNTQSNVAHNSIGNFSVLRRWAGDELMEEMEGKVVELSQNNSNIVGK